MFDFDSADGFWKMVLLPGLQQEIQRKDIQTLLAARIKGVGPHPGGKKGGGIIRREMAAQRAGKCPNHHNQWG